MTTYALRHPQLYSCPSSSFLRQGGGWYLALLVSLAALGALLCADNAVLSARHDLALGALGNRLDELDSARRSEAAARQLLLDAQPARFPAPYLVVSIADRRLWYRQGDAVLMATDIATGSGKTLVKEKGTSTWKFDTPRGRLTVTGKEANPVWVPPDWFYVEHARKKKLALAHLERGRSLAVSDGSHITVLGDNVVRSYPGGRISVLKASDQKDIIVNGRVLVPPLGTNQRRFDKVLGTHRLNLGEGYALHGTNRPETVGQAVSHGCVRLRNEDIAKLYQMVPVGTRVYIY